MLTNNNLYVKSNIPLDLSSLIKRLNNINIPLSDIFGFPPTFSNNIYEFNNNAAIIKFQNKYNFISPNRKLLFNCWFDNIELFIYNNIQNNIKHGYIVTNNNTYNIINNQNTLLLSKWYSQFARYNNSIFIIYDNNKVNIYNIESESFIYSNWFNINQLKFILTRNGFNIIYCPNGLSEMILNHNGNFKYIK